MIYVSLFNIKFGEKIEPQFIGIENYVNAFKDPVVGSAVRFTAILVLIAVTLELLLGLGIALLFFGTKGEKLYRIVMLMPLMIPPAVSGIIWKMLFNSQFGPVNYSLSFFGLPKISWFGNEIYAPLSIIITDLWQWVPFTFLVFYAGLTGIPKEIQEAAHVDGAGGFHIIRYISIPFIKPLIAVVALLRTLDVLKEFEYIFMLTGGGPVTLTYTYSYLMYMVGFVTGINVSYASALGIFLLVAALVLAALLIKTIKVKELLQIGGKL